MALTSTIAVADGWEAPNIAEIDGEADDGEQEVGLLAPSLPIITVGSSGQ